jgi:hypothetical protein
MKLVSRHMALLARLVLVVIIAASSGLTAVVHLCCMSKMDCCDHSLCAGHDDCDLPGVPPSGPSIRADGTCDTITIVGGLTIKSGEVEKEKKSELARIVIASMTPVLDHRFGESSSSSQSFFSIAVPPHPPAVEKCVLYASLLI